MIPNDISHLSKCLKGSFRESICAELLSTIEEKYSHPNHGQFNEWETILQSMPKLNSLKTNLAQESIIIGTDQSIDQATKDDLEQRLKQLSPWRKGPFTIFGVHVDSEWRSDMKWQRVVSHIDLDEKLVLDVGCGNGYYALRMQASGAKLVLGIDPMWRHVMQFLALQKYVSCDQRAFVLPLALEELPKSTSGFDTIFSMGILYHRREPQEHLQDIYHRLRNGGEFILETLIIEDQSADVLIPNKRYANMHNVWVIPGIPIVKKWLEEINFTNIEVIDITKTSTQEQRQTEWSKGYSLSHALNPSDVRLTIEGYPAPIRAIIKCNKN